MQLSNHKADSLGIISAVLCLIHCLIIPLMILGGMMNGDWGTHTQWMDYLFILLSTVAVFFAVRQMENLLLKRMMWASTLWFTTSILLHDTFSFALYSSMLASLALVVLHSINFRLHQQQHQTRKTAV